MARKSKSKSDTGSDPAGLDPTGRATDGVIDSASKAKTKPAAAKPRKKASPRKKAAPQAAKSVEPEAAQDRAPTPEPSDDEIRLRAYFLAERRMQLSLPGDSAHDWIEARRQLIEESKR